MTTPARDIFESIRQNEVTAGWKSKRGEREKMMVGCDDNAPKTLQCTNIYA